MPITFRVGDRGNSTTRTITGIAAGGVVSWSAGGALTTPVGRVFEITGNVDGTNNRNGYTCVASTASSVTLRPPPNIAGPAFGTLAMKNRADPRTVSGAGTITSILPITGTTHAIVEVAGANFLTNNIRPNDAFQITGDGVAANNGLWYVHRFPLSETRLILRPPDGGAGLASSSGGTVAIRHGIHRVTITSLGQFGELSGGPDLTFTTGVTDTIYRSDNASWITDGFAVGQTLIINNSASNDGNPTTKVITGFTTTVSANDTIELAGGSVVAEGPTPGVLVESVSLSWLFIRDNGTAQTGPGGAAMASGMLSDFIFRSSTGSRAVWLVDGITLIDFDFSALTGTRGGFLTENEVIINGRPAAPNTGGDGSSGTQIAFTPTGTGKTMLIRSGRNVNGDRSATDGSAWFNFLSNNNNTFGRIYGSVWDSLGGVSAFNRDVNTVGSLYRGDLTFLGFTTPHVIQSCIFYGGRPFANTSSAALMQNIIVPSMSLATALAGDAFLTDLSVGNNLVGWGAVSTQVNFLDPQQDIDLALYMAIGTGNKFYTYNPRFVHAKAPTRKPDPIEGLTITIYSISEINSPGTQIQVFKGKTDVNGRLADGLGVQLQRQQALGAFTFDSWSHRVVIEGVGYKRVDATITLYAPVLSDIPMLRTLRAFEEEFDPL